MKITFRRASDGAEREIEDSEVVGCLGRSDNWLGAPLIPDAAMAYICLRNGYSFYVRESVQEAEQLVHDARRGSGYLCSRCNEWHDALEACPVAVAEIAATAHCCSCESGVHAARFRGDSRRECGCRCHR